MFDIGGLEIFLVLIIALLVIGPERMPEVARQIGRFVGKTRRFIQSVKEESELRETVEQLRRELDLREETQVLREVEQDLHHDLYGNLRRVQDDLQNDLDFSELQRPTFGGNEPPPLHIEQRDPVKDGVKKPVQKSSTSRSEAALTPVPGQTSAPETSKEKQIT
jgi:sec-independent protein translocase protein TatB